MYDKETGRNAQYGIVQQAEKVWSTPNAHDGRRPGSDATSTQGRNLKREGEAWATPTSRDWKDGGDPSEAVETNSLLGRQAPRTPMPGPASSPSGPTSPRLWQTPNAKCAEDSQTHRSKERSGELLLTGQAKAATSQARRLNPRFVEWLMNFPIGWTEL